jgi:hypothetical protein
MLNMFYTRKIIVSALLNSYKSFNLNIDVLNENTIIDYNCIMFSCKANSTSLTFKTRYLTPTMYIRHKIFRPYPKDFDNNYIISVNNESKNNLKRIYKSNGEVPIIFAKMITDFHCTENKVILEETNDISEFSDYVEKDLPDINDYKFSQILNDVFKKKHNIQEFLTLEVLNKNWYTFDASCINCASKSAKEFFKWFKDTDFNSINPLDWDSTSKRVKTINCLYRSQGGIKYDGILYSFPDTMITNDEGYNNHLRCIEGKFNKYSGSESDILSITLLHELMKLYGLKTKIIINGIVIHTDENIYLKYLQDYFIFIKNYL